MHAAYLREPQRMRVTVNETKRARRVREAGRRPVLGLESGKPTLRPFLNPLRDFDQFDSASAKDLRPALYASLLFSRHHVSPVTALTASVPLA